MEQDLISILPVLCKPPSHRTQQDIGQIVEKIKHLTLFRSMSKDLPFDTVEKCASVFRYEFKSQNSMVVQYGEKADRFYVILKGRVGVLVPHRLPHKTVMKEILEMSEGSSFGELGLNEGKTRAASIQCKEDTHFMFLEKDAYLDFFVKYVRNKQKSIIGTLKHNSMFAGFSNIFLVKLSYFFSEEKVKRGNDVFREGNPADYIYLVKDGEFSLRKKINIGVNRKSDKKFAIKKNNARDSVVATISRGSFCNEEDLLNDEYMFSCKCVSIDGVVLSIKKNDLIHKIVGKDSDQTIHSLMFKKFLRKKQASNIWNVRNGVKLDKLTDDHPYLSDRSRALNQLQMRNIDKNNLFSHKGNQFSLGKKKHNLSPSSMPRISKSESLLKYYKHIVRDSPEFSGEQSFKSPKSSSPRDHNSFFGEDHSTRGFVSNGSSIAWKHKLCRYVI